MRIFRVLLVLGLVVWCHDASAQFSISKVETSRIGVAEISDSIVLKKKTAANYSNEFFNKAFWQAERKARRKERNDLDIITKLQLTQSRYDNWASAGDNTFTGRTTVYVKHIFHVKKFSLQTIFDSAYGLNYIESKRFKNEDWFKLKMTSSWNISSKWSYSLESELRSQFTTSYKGRNDNTRVSTLMAPGFLDLSIGFKYQKKPFTVLLSPVGGNAVFVLDKRFREVGMYGVDPGKKAKWTVGPSVRMNLDTKLYKDIFWLRSEVYSYTNLRKTPLVRWSIDLDIFATKFLTTTINARMHYDKESNAEKPHSPQYFSQISVGLAYTFKNK